MRNAFVPLMVFFVVAGGLAAEEEGKEKEPPALVIVSRLGVKKAVKLYNDEPIEFRARSRGRAVDLHEVGFVLFDNGGTPDRPETVRASTEDSERWGRPPSAFVLPLQDRDLPVGRYRLRATKPGHADAEIEVSLALFEYVDLKTDHEKTHYKASFVLRLEDVTEERKAVPITVLIEGPQGEPIASSKRTLRPVRKSLGVRESGPVQLSSTAKAGGKALRVVTDSTLVLVLDGLEFRYPIPLPPEEKKGQEFDRFGRPVKGSRQGR